MQETDKQIVGSDVVITFPAFGNKQTTGKIDTGATSSSLHATNVSINSNNNTITFKCPILSDNVIKMDLKGAVDVLSADGGNNSRPVIKLDVVINGTPIDGAAFNLNDRSQMDSPILLGQDIIKAGNFIIDLKKQDEKPTNDNITESTNRREKILEAIQTLADNDVSMAELLMYIKTKAVNLIEY